MTQKNFFERFPNNDARLAHLAKVKYGKRTICQHCDKASKFYKIAKQPVYSKQVLLPRTPSETTHTS